MRQGAFKKKGRDHFLTDGTSEIYLTTYTRIYLIYFCFGSIGSRWVIYYEITSGHMPSTTFYRGTRSCSTFLLRDRRLVPYIIMFHAGKQKTFMRLKSTKTTYINELTLRYEIETENKQKSKNCFDWVIIVDRTRMHVCICDLKNI